MVASGIGQDVVIAGGVPAGEGPIAMAMIPEAAETPPFVTPTLLGAAGWTSALESTAPILPFESEVVARSALPAAAASVPVDSHADPMTHELSSVGVTEALTPVEEFP
jgi:hypothetical protein